VNALLNTGRDVYVALHPNEYKRHKALVCPFLDTRRAIVQKGDVMRAPKSTDRRVNRTRTALREALITLILERGWDETSVQDVCDRGDIGRSTFYTHFVDKEDLLVSGFDEVRRTIRALGGNDSEQKPLAFVRGMAEHVNENRSLFRAIVGKRSGQAVQKRFQQLLLDLVQEDLARVATAGPRLDATVHFVSGALFQMFIWWVDSRNSFRPTDVARLFDELTTPVIAVLKRPR
jgi:AcrR family transcriptional regulator